MKIEHKVVPVVETKVIDEDQGIVGAFVSVTGVVDSVKDRIIPGAYEKTLKVRTPKGVFSHDWDQPVARTLEAEELLPGDDRLPTKTRNGEEWPAMAGALYVEAQFNLETQRGKEAFSDVKFYGSDAEWSIGYNVPPGASKVDNKTGVRELSYIDLYEYSPVLFGAMSLTQTAGFKDAQEAFRAAVKAGDATPDMVVEEEREEQKDAPEPVAEGFTEVTEDTPVTTPQDPIHQVTPGHTGKPAGVDVEPRPTVEGPPGEAEVSPAKSAEFTVSLTPEAEDAIKAINATLSTDMLGGSSETWATLIQVAQEKVKAITDDRASYTVLAVEEKAYVTLTGSYEERIQACQRALRDNLHDVGEDLDIDMDESDDWGYPRWYVTTEATFNNRVVAAAYDMNGESPVRFFEASYAFDGQQSTLRNVREVRLEATVAAKSAERLESMRLSAALFRKAAGQDVATPHPTEAAPAPPQAKSHLKVGRGDSSLYVTVGVTSKHAVDTATLRDAIEKALEPLVPEGTPAPPQADDVAPEADEAPDAAPEGEGTTVTLSEADMLLLERLKLSA